ncbi:hypothetical protein [Clostridium pasteurianum]|uniref:DUF4872 domain-containing protein n=1 Tax=Clostridium pasteurianum BC1 TaxID=86416 RepID=R4K9D4_CLOPA|nr:hypothetical protein [Clostridium pasteurianum]AGK99168.1 hypothetical protein Clopa_4457 [Clostridium pasteurianum BC1]
MVLNIITTIVVAIIVIIFLYFLIINFYQKKYYDQAYRPKSIKFGRIPRYPEKTVIEGLKGVSSEKQYQEAAAIKMINDKVYPKESISTDNINFLMGYTYGVSFNSIKKNFIPFSEPIEGLRIAAPFMGLHMDYRTTYSPNAFVGSIKEYISQGYPVMVQLDMSTLLGTDGFYPNSELLVGYDRAGFYYYETMGKDNKEKKYVSKQKLIDATNKLNAKFRKPWRYGFCIFTTREKNININKILKRNGNSLTGEINKAVYSGAKAIKEFAKVLKETNNFNNQWILETLAYTRKDNAKFLEERFKDNNEIIEASKLFNIASENYKKAFEIIKASSDEDSIKNISELLLENCKLEEKIGNIFENFSGV